MVQPGVIGQLVEGDYGPALGIGGAADQALDTGLEHGPHTHNTRFYGNIERAARQSIIADPGCRLPQGHDLGVGRRVLGGNGLVVSPADNRPRRIHHYGPDGDLPGLPSLPGFGQGQLHIV